LSGHPVSVQGKLMLAKQQVAHDRLTADPWLRRDRAYVRKLRRQLHPLSNVQVICRVFGPYCGQAIRVSRCETGGAFNTNAQNGQYLGLFQMGSYARSRYGHGSSAWVQARAAYRYFIDSGRDWSPWSCGWAA
jgi:hypothetical protein